MEDLFMILAWTVGTACIVAAVYGRMGRRSARLWAGAGAALIALVAWS